jgi:NADH-quinone oxidoreductase subunit L
MRHMGGIWNKIPFTYAMMWIGSLALAGVPFFAGFYSKDMIVEAAFAHGGAVGQYAFAMGVLAALLTAFYSWRLLFLTFHGKPRADHHTMEHVHESPLVMTLPLAVLALGAVFAGWAFAPWFIGHEREAFWGAALVLPAEDVIEAAHHAPGWVAWTPTVMGAIGILVAWIFYIRRPGIPGALAETNRPLYLFLLNKWYFDELYDLVLVRPARWLGRVFWKQGDGAVIDGLGPDGIAAVTRDLAARAARLQSGYLYHYAFAMLIGVAALVSFFIYRIGPTH